MSGPSFDRGTFLPPMEPPDDSTPPDDPRRPAMRKPSYDEIAMHAYFIALEKARLGQPSHPLEDWIQAERELRNRNV